MLQINYRQVIRNSFLFSLLLVSIQQASANFARISRAGFALPADDLVYQNQVLSPEEARRLSLQGLDLSELNPTVLERGIWENTLGNRLNEDLDEMPIESGEIVRFQGAIRSNPGEFRFNFLT